MTGDISGKRANQSLKEHLSGPKLTHTHTHLYTQILQRDGRDQALTLRTTRDYKDKERGGIGTGWEGEDTDAMEVILVTG